jgi:predicted 3-demethylubiquinone-9 3-methyltransferase (glyoxalase superfamily)
MGYGKSGSTHAQAVGNLSLIALYYLLQIGEYTVKQQHDHTKRAKKQTVQFKLEDVTFFKSDKNGTLRCLPCNAPYSLIMTVESTTLKLDNQKEWLERSVRSPGG